MRKNFPGDRRRRTNDRAFARKGFMKLRRKRFEQLDMLRFFARKLQKSADAVIVFIERRANVIEHERQDEFFDEPENCEIRMPFDLIEHEFFISRQKIQIRGSDKRFGQKRLCKIELPRAADNVLDAPVYSLRCDQRFAKIIGKRPRLEIVINSL